MPIAITILQTILELAQYGPAFATAAVNIAHSAEPTQADFIALFTLISQEDYDTLLAARKAARGITGITAGPLSSPPPPNPAP